MIENELTVSTMDNQMVCSSDRLLDMAASRLTTPVILCSEAVDRNPKATPMVTNKSIKIKNMVNRCETVTPGKIANRLPGDVLIAL